MVGSVIIDELHNRVRQFIFFVLLINLVTRFQVLINLWSTAYRELYVS